MSSYITSDEKGKNTPWSKMAARSMIHLDVMVRLNVREKWETDELCKQHEAALTRRLLPEVAYSLLMEIQRGSQCYLVSNQTAETAYLERNGRCWPVDAQLVVWLISKQYLRQRTSDRVATQAVLLTPRGRAALTTRRHNANGWRPPFTREQRLLLATLPLCWVLGTAATVFAAEIGLAPSGWTNVLNSIAICLPLLIVYVFVRWRGW